MSLGEAVPEPGAGVPDGVQAASTTATQNAAETALPDRNMAPSPIRATSPLNSAASGPVEQGLWASANASTRRRGPAKIRRPPQGVRQQPEASPLCLLLYEGAAIPGIALAVMDRRLRPVPLRSCWPG